MRISEIEKTKTREKILQAAESLFAARGFQETTTRDIAKAAGIGVGTLFNYFPTKEAVGNDFISAALLNSEQEFLRWKNDVESLDEATFLFCSSWLRALLPYRHSLRPALEGAAFSFSSASPKAGSVGALHIAILNRSVFKKFLNHELNLVALHTYLGLFITLFVFWLDDESHNQEKTLALLDHHIQIFVSTLPEKVETKESRKSCRS